MSGLPYDVYVLTESDTGFSARLRGELDAHGLHFAMGNDPEPARVLLCVSAPAAELLVGAARRGVAVLSVRAEPGGWLTPDTDLAALATRVVVAVEALLSSSAPERLHHDDVVARALHEVATLVSLREGEPLEQVCDAISLAISRGAPIYNAGNDAGCAQLYRHTATVLLELLEEYEDGLLDAVQGELATALTAADEDEGDDDAAAWTLRHAFDRIIIARHTAEAMQTLDGLFDGLRGAGRSLNASLVYDVISLAISHGAPIYNAGSHVGCAQIYLRTARGLLACLGPESAGPGGRTETLARRTLPPLLEDHEQRMHENATDFSWDLRHAFDALVEAAAEERSWEHDS